MTPLRRVVRTTVFKGFARLIIGENHRLLQPAADSRLERARYDLVVLVEATTPIGAADLRHDPHYQRLAMRVKSTARRTFELVTHNQRNMGEVDVTLPGVFLFNFFYAEDARRLVPVGSTPPAGGW